MSTGSTTSDRSSKLTERGRALLAARIRGEHSAGSSYASIPPSDATAPAPLSLMQERIWIFQQLNPESAAYHIVADVALSGSLNVEVLEAALFELLKRHEALRTTISLIDGAPVQVVGRPSSPVVPIVDLRDCEDKERELLKRVAEHSNRTFDLAAGPLCRHVLFRLEDAEHVLLITIHHIVCDGWSINLLLTELSAVYNAIVASAAPDLSPLALRYSDYARWERRKIGEASFESELAYWKKQLQGASLTLDFPMDQPSAAVSSSFQVGRKSFWLDLSARRSLSLLGNENGATLFDVLLAVFGVLLHKYTGGEDFVVASPISNRDRAETQNVVGLFLNTLLLRIRPSSELTFRELLVKVHRTTIQAYSNQEVPAELLERLLMTGSRTHRSSEIRVMLNLNNTPAQPVQVAGLKVKRKLLPGTSLPSDLTVLVQTNVRESGAVLVTFRYASSLFSESTIERLTRYFEMLLPAVVAEPDVKLSELSVVSDNERQLLLTKWNDTKADFPVGKCLHELFAAQAAKTPDAVAIAHEGSELSYGELDRRSNQLAQHLRRLGVGPETIVGLCVERSPEIVVGLLGILKAGGAYLPLDPGYPAERLSRMLADTKAPIVVTQAALVDRLSMHEGRILRIDTDWSLISAQPDAAPLISVDPDNLACVTYTSGSTGSSKGAMTRHCGIVSYLAFMVRTYRLGADHAILHVSSISFDPSIRDLFGPLVSGGRLVILRAGDAKDPRKYLEAIQNHKVTAILSITPSLLRAIVDDARRGAFALEALRLVLSCGEPLPYALCSVAREVFCNAQLVNQYGVTEYTMASTYFSIAEGGVGVAPIGHPVWNTRVYVLDRDLGVVPIGAVGELYIGGVGLARGYLGRAGLTGERFVPSPYGDGERLYRTGDLVRWRADGDLEYLGRIDHQVKIRGYRIELGEIEAGLVEHPDVHQAVVVAREDTAGDRRLVAYVVAADAAIADVGGLRAHLKRSLPDYMVPSAFVLLDALPLTPNGKVDRRALPAPEDDAVVRGEYVAPRTPAEEVLASIWAEVLKLDRVGVHDNFFELGGHSLLAMPLIARLRNAFQTELPLRSLFEAPSVGELATRVEAAQREGLGLMVPALAAGLRPEVLPLSHAQERLWLLEQIGGLGSAYNMPAAVRLRGVLDEAALERSFAAVVARHEALRTRFAVADGSPVQVIDPAGSFELAIEDLSELPERERSAAARQRMQLLTQQGFDLERGPLFQAHLLRLSAEEHVAVVVMHHIVSDGWSIGVLIREVGALYAAFSQGRASPLPELAVQYADYALWQRGWLQGEVLEKQVAFWRDQLAGAPAALELPTDRARPAVQSYRGAHHGFALPAELTASLNELARSEGATLYMVLLAAFNVLLSRWSGQSDIVVGSPIAGRTHRELESLIGFFVNTLVIRTDLGGDPGFRKLLQQVKETALGAYAHQDLPFEKLVTELQPVRDLSRQPLFQALLALQNVPQETLQLPGLELSRIGGGRPTAKFDLSLYVHEREGRLEGSFEYATDLFEASTIERLAEHWVTLLEAAVARPDVALSDLSMVGAAELGTRQVRALEVASLGSDRAAGIAHSGSVTDCFLRQARSRPNAIAIVADQQCWSYGRLNHDAGRIAALLLNERGASNEPIGLLFPHAPMMVAAILGVLGAGKFYVPLSPDDPPARLRAIMTESRCGCVLVSPELGRLGEELGVAVLSVDTAPDEPIELLSRPSGSIAYVLYTSGTTGMPKGVAQRDCSILQHIAVYTAALTFEASDRMTLMASYGTDAAVKNIFGTLLSGAALYLWDVRKQGVEGLQRWLVENAITIWHSTPSLLRAAMPQFASKADLRWVVLGGEGAKPEDIAIVQRHAGANCRLLTAFSQTECSTASHYAPDFERDLTRHRLPVGRPVPGAAILLLDEAGRPSDIRGEVAIGGRGIALGYWQRASLTAERFIPSPYGEGERLYRTGDLARWRADGELEYLGRIDHQVNIRGYRIEPGEVEAALVGHPDVDQAVVVARNDAARRERLVAYVVGHTAAPVDVGKLRLHLKRSLPEYMVPSAFVVLEALPLTPNRKVDRRALPAPEEALVRGEYVAPRTRAEEMLASIWAGVLKLERVGANDNFFELGGHSLLAMRVIARVREAFQIELPLRTLFEAPTLREYCEQIEVFCWVKATEATEAVRIDQEEAGVI